MFTIKYSQDHPPGWKLPFFLYVDSGELEESMLNASDGNCKSVRNTELMIECKDCLFERWNDQTATTHIERWANNK